MTSTDLQLTISCMTNNEKLRFILRFAQDINVNTMRPGDLLNLRDDLQKFIGVREVSAERDGNWMRDLRDRTYVGLNKGQAGVYIPLGDTRVLAKLEKTSEIVAIPIGEPFPWTYEIPDFLSLQTKSMEFLRRYFESKKNSKRFVLRIDPTKVQDAPKEAKDQDVVTLITWESFIGRLFMPAQAGVVVSQYGTYELVMGFTTEDCFFKVLHRLIISKEAKKLSTCPECGKTFLRNRKQQYCSKECTNKVTFRRWQKTQAVLLYNRESFRARRRNEQIQIEDLTKISQIVRANPRDVLVWIEEHNKERSKKQSKSGQKKKS